MFKYCKSSGEWNISWRRFDRQRGEKLARTSSTKVRLFRKLSETSEQWPERAERLEALSKAKQDLRLTHRQLVNKEKCNVSAPWGRFNYLTDYCNCLPKYINKNVKLRHCMCNVKGYSLKYNIYVHFVGLFLY